MVHHTDTMLFMFMLSQFQPLCEITALQTYCDIVSLVIISCL